MKNKDGSVQVYYYLLQQTGLSIIHYTHFIMYLIHGFTYQLLTAYLMCHKWKQQLY